MDGGGEGEAGNGVRWGVAAATLSPTPARAIDEAQAGKWFPSPSCFACAMREAGH